MTFRRTVPVATLPEHPQYGPVIRLVRWSVTDPVYSRRPAPGPDSGAFLCPVPGCGLALRSQPRLSEHLSWHRGETQCPVCGLRLTSKHNMWKHASYKHGVTMQPGGGRRGSAGAGGAGVHGSAAGAGVSVGTGSGLGADAGPGARIYPSSSDTAHPTPPL